MATRKPAEAAKVTDEVVGDPTPDEVTDESAEIVTDAEGQEVTGVLVDTADDGFVTLVNPYTEGLTTVPSEMVEALLASGYTRS